MQKLSSGSISKGYDAASDSFVDMFDAGIIDPFLVVKSSIRNATSAAINILSAGCAIAISDRGDDYENQLKLLSKDYLV